MSSHRPLCIVLLLLLGTTAQAGDEDMSPSAYHVFDPETGYMITVDPLAEEQPLAEGDDANVDAEDKVQDEPAAPLPWGYWIGLIVLIGGVIAWFYRRREKK